MSNEIQMREQFEREHAKLFPLHSCYVRGEKGEYIDVHCQLAFLLWQAALSSLPRMTEALIAADEALAMHHQWHMNIGEVIFPDIHDSGTGDALRVDLSDGYADSGMGEKTLRARALFAKLPHIEAPEVK